MMPDENAAVQTPNPAIEHLAPLIGTWSVSSPDADRIDQTEGNVTYEWLEGQAFLKQHWNPPDPMPDGVAVIGCDDSTGRCAMHYFDDRGVARLYELSLSDGVLKQWREAPGFSQRFSGTFSEDGDTISGTWELCRDGTTWEKDFDLVYRRMK